MRYLQNLLHTLSSFVLWSTIMKGAQMTFKCVIILEKADMDKKHGSFLCMTTLQISFKETVHVSAMAYVCLDS